MRKEFIQLLEDNGFVVVEIEFKNLGMDYWVLDGSDEKVQDITEKYGKRYDIKNNNRTILYSYSKSLIKIHFRERNPEVYIVSINSGLEWIEIEKDKLEEIILCKLYEMFE